MYLLIADDLTGGNDAGIQFAKHGIPARMTLSPDQAAGNVASCGSGMLVVNTNTRNLPDAEAASLLADVAETLKRETACAPPGMVFKKIDSTLRGNPGAEIDVLMRGFGFTMTFLAPSYPEQGRTVKRGLLFVNNVPVHETVFAQDPLTPIRESSIAAILRGQTARKTAGIPLSILEQGPDRVVAEVCALAASGVEMFIFDAMTSGHLAVVAAAGLAMKARPLFAGSAGLAAALAKLLPGSEKSGISPQGSLVPVEHIFFICGSANQATHAQTAELETAGIPVIRLSDRFFDGAGEAQTATTAVLEALGTGAATLATPLARISDAGNMSDGLALSDAVADMAVGILRMLAKAPQATALVMTGGETAYNVLEKLGGGLALHAEISPGIALCTLTGGPWDGLRVITKAGGFGIPGTLVDILNMLRHRKAA